MKLMKYCLLSVIFFALGLSAISQNLILKRSGINISNDSITLTGSPDDNLISLNIGVVNTSDFSMDVKVRKTVMRAVSGSTNTYCWAGVCFIPSVDEAPLSVSIAPGVTDSSSFVGDYQSNGISGTTVIRYSFFNVAKPSDNVSVTVFFAINTSSVDASRVTKPWFRAYPNPADRQLSVLVSDRARGVVHGKLVNIQGQILLHENAPAERRNWNWTTGSLPEGIYFLDVSDEGGWRTVQKIWIRH